MTTRSLRLGLIGLDTSHVEGFAMLLNDPRHPEHIPGARIVAGYPGGSADFPLSADRVGGYTQMLRERFGVTMVDHPSQLAGLVDAILLTSVDGRIHRDQFSTIAQLRLPVYIDKPFTTTTADAQAIVAMARHYQTPVFTCSSLRYAGALREALADDVAGRIIGADFHGPLPLEPTQPGFFWYGIHTVEMLYATLGPGCRRLRVTSTAGHDTVAAIWRDGRIGGIRGLRGGKHAFGGMIYREKGNQPVDVNGGVRADIGLTIAILLFCREGVPPVAVDESLEIVRFIEAANESRAQSGREVML